MFVMKKLDHSYRDRVTIDVPALNAEIEQRLNELMAHGNTQSPREILIQAAQALRQVHPQLPAAPAATATTDETDD